MVKIKSTLPKLARVAPILDWAPRYQRDWLPADLIAGLTVVAVLIPSALAYADLAGMPAVNGLYAAFIAMLVYAVLGTSRHLGVGPESGSAVLVATVLGIVAPPSPEAYLVYAAALALLVGGFLIAGGVLKLGFLADYLSKPVLTGYLIGVGLIIILSQLGKIFGISLENDDFFAKLFELIRRLGETHVPTFVFAVILIAAYYALRRFVPRIPTALAIVGLATLVSWLLDLSARGVSVVGEVPRGLPSLQLPLIGPAQAVNLLPGALAIAILVFSDATVAARRAALRNKYDTDTNKEMIALGAMNVATAFFQGFPIGSSQSRTLVNDTSGAKTQVAGVIGAGVVVAVLLFLTPLIAPLPQVALAVIVIISALGLIDLQAVVALFKVNRFVGLLSVVTTLGVLGIGLVGGILIAVFLSLIYVISRIAKPHDAVLILDATGDSVIESDSTDAQIAPGLIAYRFDQLLFFANANYFRERVRTLVRLANPPPRAVLVDASGVTEIDLTAADMLETLRGELADQGVQLMLARVKSGAMTSLRTSGLLERIGADNVFGSVHDGARAFQARGAAPTAVEPVPAQAGPAEAVGKVTGLEES